MCGLFGIMGNIQTLAERRRVKELFALNYFRGADSTGMIDHLPGNGKDAVRYWKREMDAFEFINVEVDRAEKGRWKKRYPDLIMGHCRAATLGKITAANAHPFHHGNIIGMHNGTVSTSFPNKAKFDTDSEAIFHNINEYNDLTKVIHELDTGAFALAWLDLRDGSVNLVRNSQRPLHIAEEAGVFYWSSEREHLELVLRKRTGIEMLPVHVHLNIRYKKGGFTMQRTDIPFRALPATTTTYHGTYTGSTYRGNTYSETINRNGMSFDKKDWYSLELLLKEYDRIESMGKTTKPLYGTFIEFEGLWYSEWQHDRLMILADRQKELEKLQKTHEEKQKKLEKEREANKSNVVPFGENGLAAHIKSVKVLDDVWVEPQEYLRLLSYGCYGCGEVVTPNTFVVFMEDQVKQYSYCCEDCLDKAINKKDDMYTWVVDWLPDESLAAAQKYFEEVNKFDRKAVLN